MSITVVVTRDYDNVPSCFEKYERGTRWRVNSGNLEIFVGTTLAALYPSGNWVSVYLDDAMQLHKGSDKPDYSGMPTVTAGGPVPVTPGAPLDPDDVPWSHPTDADQPFDDVPLATTASLFPDDDVVAGRAAMMPVAFRPRRYRGTPAPAKKAPTGPRLLPVRLRMRRSAPSAAPEAAGTDAPRMMPVTMRTTIYRAARERPAPEDPDDDVRNDVRNDE